jgi:hypothetical protein
MTKEIEQTSVDPSQVKGWGVDADRGNDPTYPMKRRNDGEHEGYSWERPTQQQSDVEVLHSIERPNVSAAFGTSTPRACLSGVIRRFAFRYSESSYGHWLPLMPATSAAFAQSTREDRGAAARKFHAYLPQVEFGYRYKRMP